MGWAGRLRNQGPYTEFECRNSKTAIKKYEVPRGHTVCIMAKLLANVI
jgi:hypothetical protein